MDLEGSDDSASSTELSVQSSVQPTDLFDPEVFKNIEFPPYDPNLYGDLGDTDGFIASDGINSNLNTFRNAYKICNSNSPDLQFSRIWGPTPFPSPQHATFNFLALVCRTDPLLKHNSAHVLQSLCAIPEQTVRRTTLPPFIHPHWHLTEMPAPLAVCMRIAQLFVARTAATTGFIWRSIMGEQRRAVERLEVGGHSREELLAALQAGIVYLMMRVVEEAVEPVEWNSEFALAQKALCDRFIDLHDGKFCESELDNPSLTWEDWIYAESRRRTSCIWFLITRTIFVRTKAGCPTSEDPGSLPLPSPRTQWEARTREEWLGELDVAVPMLSTYGNLIESRTKAHEAIYGRGLQAWNAQADNLGSLLNMATVMV